MHCAASYCGGRLALGGVDSSKGFVVPRYIALTLTAQWLLYVLAAPFTAHWLLYVPAGPFTAQWLLYVPAAPTFTVHITHTVLLC